MEMHEELALKKICEAYAQSRPKMEDLAKDHEWAVNVVQLFKFAASLNPGDASNRAMAEHYDHLLAHLNDTFGVLKMLHGSAMYANAVMSEHKEATEGRSGEL